MPYKLNDVVSLDSHSDFELAAASDNATAYSSPGSNLSAFVTELESVLGSSTYQINPRGSNVSLQVQVRLAVGTALGNQALNDSAGTGQTDWEAEFMMRSEQGPGGWGHDQYSGFFKLARTTSGGREVYSDGSNNYVFFHFEIVNY